MNPLDKPGTHFALGLWNPNPTSSKTKDGPVYRVSFEMAQEDWQLFMDANTKGLILACEAHVPKDAPDENRTPEEEPSYGWFAQELHKRGAFFAPEVIAAVGSDDDYQDWCRAQRCCVCGADPAYTVYHHVLRANLAPAREGSHPNKPAYSGIPLCGRCHSRRHDGGASALWPESGMEAEDRAKATFISKWVHQRFRLIFEVDSLTKVEPERWQRWSIEQSIHPALFSISESAAYRKELQGPDVPAAAESSPRP